ncbi:EamA family transporter [Kiritimatiellaeota bacterium B1221]|nr:EamA family transporter [Kiritimatiellaeota bacterium B1221]
MIWLLTACLLWGPSFGLIPILVGKYGMNPFMLSVLRMAFSFILFAPLMGGHPLPSKQKLQLILLGGLQFGVMYLTLFVSYSYMEGYEVALVTIFTPLYVTLFDRILNKQCCKLKLLISVILAVIGAGIIRYARVHDNSEFWFGFGLLQICNLSFAIGQVIYKRFMKSTEGLQDMFAFGWMYLGAFMVTLIGWALLAPMSETLQHLQKLPLAAWAIVLWLGLIPSGLAFFMFNHGSLQVDTGTLAIINNLKIPIALLIVLLIFRQGEAIESWTRFTVGTLLMLGALWLNQRPTKTPGSPTQT